MSDSQSTLAEAFEVFNSASAQLIESYRGLERQVETLGAELALSNQRRLDELAEKERLAERLSRLLEALPAAVVVVDEHGTVTTANPAAEQWLQAPLGGRPWQAVASGMREAPDGSGDFLLPGGRRVAITRRQSDGTAGTIVLLHDVTETRALQEGLHRHRRLTAMGEMVAGLAHQVRTPLSAALLYAEQLGVAGLGDDDRARLSERVQGRLRHMERLVQDMLVFVRGGGGELRPVGADELARALRSQLEAELTATQARLVLDGWDPRLSFSCNPDALVSALTNLVRNGIEAAGEGARVSAVVRRLADGQAEILVSDNGPGVPPHIAERIFEPFFTTRARGTGLGLAVVREIARAHGGEATVQPGPEGYFSLRLPQAGEARAPGTEIMEVQQ